MEHKEGKIYGTTILSVRKGNMVAIAGDGQVSLGNTVMKATAKKIRELSDGKIISGFAGSTADALTLYERLEGKLEKYPNQLRRACVELTKDWRLDKYLRKLEAMMLVVDKEYSLILTGSGDVLEPDDGVMAIGSGGGYALSAAKALIAVEDDTISAEDIVRKALLIASDICVFTNDSIMVKTITY